MTAISTAELVNVWERGLGHPAWQRALDLLRLAGATQPARELAQLTIGERDRNLMELRERLFGRQITGLADCPSCGAALELTLDLAEFERQPTAVPEALTIQHDGYELTVRLPNSLDLEAVDAPMTPDQATAELFRRCLVEARRSNIAVSADQVPPEAIAAVGEQLSEADPQTNLQFAVSCPTCDHQWLVPFDIASFLWTEIQAWAQRVLGEVHELAMAYHWREADILALSPWRRQAYLELIHA